MSSGRPGKLSFCAVGFGLFKGHVAGQRIRYIELTQSITRAGPCDVTDFLGCNMLYYCNHVTFAYKTCVLVSQRHQTFYKEKDILDILEKLALLVWKQLNKLKTDISQTFHETH